MSNRITVVGSSNVDFIVSLPRLPQLGETVSDGVFMQTFGGKGANQAVAAARAGGNVAFITGLGNDDFAILMRDNFIEDGLDVSHALYAPETPCGSAFIMVNPQGGNYIAVSPGANYALSPAYIERCEAFLLESSMIVLQMEIPIQTILKTLEIAAKNDIPTLLNYAPVRNKEIPISNAITGLVVNEAEARELCGKEPRTPEEALEAARLLLKMGPKFVVITLGAQGAVCLSSRESRYVAALPTIPVDTTAAGDTFCGAMATALAEGKTLADAVRFANAAASLSVSKMGARPSIPMRKEIDAKNEAGIS